MSVAACLEGVLAEHGRLDAVVNNAGAAHVGTLETDDLAAIRACLEVNLFGVVTVSRAALPHLRASDGLLLPVSSVGGIVGQPFNEAYCAAKFADVIVDAREAPSPPFRIQTSEWARDFVATKLADLDGTAVQTLATQWAGGGPSAS